MKRRLLLLLFLVTPLILAGFRTATAANDDTVGVQNGAIRVFVNNTGDGRGRFAVDVTGGDASRTDDDNQPLIYGRPIPWTSFTTIRLDGLDFAFGGPSSRRAGKGLAIGEMAAAPAVRENAIVTVCRYGDLEVTQYLSIVDGPNTGLPDTARIAYTMVNRGQTPHQVGLRMCLDTMLGSNDGAPFRMGDSQILSDTAIARSGLSPYWQAFDSLDQPRVIAQGTLAGGELTPPDRMNFSNWGSLADYPWEIKLVPGRDFTRLGEFEPDSAVALYWDEALLPPGGVISRVTYYGLGSVTVAKGELTLGVTSPATVNSGEKSFMVLGYVENKGSGIARNVSLELALPAFLKCSSPRTTVGNLKPGETRQVAWMVQPAGWGKTSLRVTARASDISPVSVERSIVVIAPPSLRLTLGEMPEVKTTQGSYQPYPAEIAASVKNQGGGHSNATWAELVPTSGTRLAPGETGRKFIGILAPGEQVEVRWALTATGGSSLAGFTVLAGSNECPSQEQTGSFGWPDLPRQLQVITAAVSGQPRWRRFELRLRNASEAAQITLRLDVAPGTRLLDVQRGGFFVVGKETVLPLSRTQFDANHLVLKAARPVPLGGDNEILATIWVLVNDQTAFKPKIEVLELLDIAGKPIPVTVVFE